MQPMTREKQLKKQRKTDSAIINPHQRCGYSDSPFAKKDTFLYCRVGWRGWTSREHTHKKQVDPKKKTLFCYRKIC